MAYLTIIAQTFGFEDSYGYFTAALLKSSKALLCYEINGVKFKKHRFDRVIITKDGGIIFLPPVIKHYRNKNIYEIDQWMGAGKSVVGMEHLGRVHARGGTIMANMAIGYMEHNLGKPKEQWTPNIQNLDDLKSVNNCTILIDDFKKIVQRWQCSEAVFIGMVANESRKDKKDILITAQRVVNFIPKDIREVCTNYEIPYVTIRDQRVESPDGMGMPVEIEVFNVSATGSFLGFGIWNGFFPDGKTLSPTKKMLDMYNTREVVTDLKAEEDNNTNIEAKEPYLGYNNEIIIFNDLKNYKGVIRHLAAEIPKEHPTDILFQNGKLWEIDSVAVYKKGNQKYLTTRDKDFTKFVGRPKYELDRCLLAFLWKDDKIRYLGVKHLIGTSGDTLITREIRRKMSSGDKLFTPLFA